jgi:hypothetical protein
MSQLDGGTSQEVMLGHLGYFLPVARSAASRCVWLQQLPRRSASRYGIAVAK